MTDIRSSSETLEGITRYMNEHGGAFSLILVEGVWIALLKPDDGQTMVGSSVSSAGDATERLLVKAEVPRIPEFAPPPTPPEMPPPLSFGAQMGHPGGHYG